MWCLGGTPGGALHLCHASLPKGDVFEQNHRDGMSIRRTSAASERSSLMSAEPKQDKTHPAEHAEREGEEATSPAKRAASSTHSKAKASSPKQSRKYAPSMTSSQMTYETMDYTNDSASTRTAQRETAPVGWTCLIHLHLQEGSLWNFFLSL